MKEEICHIKIAVEDPTSIESIQSAVNDDPTVRVVETDSEEYADLLVLEINNGQPDILDDIECLLDAGKNGDLFLMAKNADSNLLMELMRIGVKEFLPIPLKADEFKMAMDRFKKRADSGQGKAPKKKEGKIISVVGSKGGVGTTTVAVNLAADLAGSKSGAQVALFDLNTLFGEIPLFLGLTPKFHWGEITKNIERLDQMFLMNVLAKHRSGIHLLPSPAYLNGNNSPSLDVIDRICGMMRTLFDYIIVDAGQSMADANLRVIQHSEQVLLISLLNLPCLSNTNRLVKSLTEMGYASQNRLKVVINRYLRKGEITVNDAQAGIGEDVLCVIPNDYRTTMTAINQGKPIRDVAPKSGIAGSFQQLAMKLAPQQSHKKERRWRIFGR